MKQGHVFLKKLPKQLLQYAILLLGAFCALVPIVSCVTTAFKNDEEYRTTSVMTLPESWLIPVPRQSSDSQSVHGCGTDPGNCHTGHRLSDHDGSASGQYALRLYFLDAGD